ncbi:MAG TPA: hypothetical protein ENI19_00140 [Candidatus Nealsonbacteria bacterium]|uniref:Uncharacterized protein n=1 Tax=marine sediment metagenome TaxID=412755 RepID=A0A0F9UZJ0_9ZZZZ|nr:hypothetical protein [Candidatus Nealsonbacteria bacterium]HEB46114.1 hypothetical protein [Candidatus Nealsonbacteria bacterium]
MPFITQGKTNLTYILIVIILAIIVGGGILGYQYLWMPKQEITPPEVKPPEGIIEDETANWETVEIFGWNIKYPPSPYPCGPTEGYPVCMNGSYSNDLFIGSGGWYSTERARVCGTDYDDCLKGVRNSFTELEYEKERTINNVKGREFFGIFLGTKIEKIFVFETHQRDGILQIRQTNLSPELDSIYEKILTTISPSD